MKLMTYMTRFLTSILLVKNSNQENIEVSKIKDELEDLKKENQELKTAVEEIIVCLNQVTATTAALVTQLTVTSNYKSTSDDAVDEMLDNLWKKDDDDPGYLN